MCAKCEEYGGGWRMVNGGLAPCDCVDGERRRKAGERRENLQAKPPVVTEMEAAKIGEMFVGIPFFPREGGYLAMVSDQIRSMCSSASNAVWLAQRMNQLFTRRWPGVEVMREVYCAKFLPHDGRLSDVICEDYPDGIPSEIPSKAALPAAGRQKALPAGTDPAADETIRQEVRQLADQLGIDPYGRAKCRRCDGEGKYLVRVAAELGVEALESSAEAEMVTCKVCNGTGRVALPRKDRRDETRAARLLEAVLTPPDQRKDEK